MKFNCLTALREIEELVSLNKLQFPRSWLNNVANLLCLYFKLIFKLGITVPLI